MSETRCRKPMRRIALCRRSRKPPECAPRCRAVRLPRSNGSRSPPRPKTPDRHVQGETGSPVPPPRSDPGPRTRSLSPRASGPRGPRRCRAAGIYGALAGSRRPSRPRPNLHRKRFLQHDHAGLAACAAHRRQPFADPGNGLIASGRDRLGQAFDIVGQHRQLAACRRSERKRGSLGPARRWRGAGDGHSAGQEERSTRPSARPKPRCAFRVSPFVHRPSPAGPA